LLLPRALLIRSVAADAGAPEFVKGASPRALETMPPQPAPAEPVTTKKLDGHSHGKAAARWSVGGCGPCLVTERP
jgi:hypothetical protein